MRSFTDIARILAPGLAALTLMFLFAAPLHSALPLAPNVAFVMTILVGTFAPASWPRWFAFLLGLLQDVLMGTPLGSQALLSLVLSEMVRANARRHQYQLFRVRWMEAAGALVVVHGLLWLILHQVNREAPPVQLLLVAGLFSGLWYPVLYKAMSPLLERLPGRA